MKKLFLFVALFAWIGFSASAQVQKESKNEEHKKSNMTMDQNMHHWVVKNGKVMEMKDGKSTEMTSETQVGDAWIRPNGDVVMKNNKVVHLKSNEYLDAKGMIHHMDKNKTDKMKTEKMNMDKNKMEPPKVEPQK